MTAQYIIRAMSEQTAKIRIVKSWRLPPEVLEAIRDAAIKLEYPDETAYVEDVFRRVLGLPERAKPQPKPLRISKEAMALRT
jgi:hypothetical protein